jgi:thioesterase domain-containing protein
MAAQLTASGEEVALLALLDARWQLPNAPSLLASDEGLFALFLRDHELDDSLPTCPERPARALAEGQRRGIIPSSLSLDEFVELATRYGQVFQENVRLARTYTPSGRVPRVLVVEAVDHGHLQTAPVQWEAWADAVERRWVAGDHHSILRPPQVDAVAAIMRAHLSATSLPRMSQAVPQSGGKTP